MLPAADELVLERELALPALEDVVAEALDAAGAVLLQAVIGGVDQLAAQQVVDVEAVLAGLAAGDAGVNRAVGDDVYRLAGVGDREVEGLVLAVVAGVLGGEAVRQAEVDIEVRLALALIVQEVPVLAAVAHVVVLRVILAVLDRALLTLHELRRVVILLVALQADEVDGLRAALRVLGALVDAVEALEVVGGQLEARVAHGALLDLELQGLAVGDLGNRSPVDTHVTLDEVLLGLALETEGDALGLGVGLALGDGLDGEALVAGLQEVVGLAADAVLEILVALAVVDLLLGVLLALPVEGEEVVALALLAGVEGLELQTIAHHVHLAHRELQPVEESLLLLGDLGVQLLVLL